jgi:hypothetical protein
LQNVTSVDDNAIQSLKSIEIDENGRHYDYDPLRRRDPNHDQRFGFNGKIIDVETGITELLKSIEIDENGRHYDHPNHDHRFDYFGLKYIYFNNYENNNHH